MSKVSSLSVFFPCYNEEANVENMVRKAQQILPELAEKWEIIPVNDGSKDNSRQIIDRLAQEDSNVHPVHHEKNQGYGGAVISGYNAAKYDLVFFTDGDLQFDLSSKQGSAAQAIGHSARRSCGSRCRQEVDNDRRL